VAVRMFISFIRSLLPRPGCSNYAVCKRSDSVDGNTADAGGAGGCAIYRPLQVCLVVEGKEDAADARCSRSELDRDPEITRW
jgi:hypothetical protein